MEPLQLQSESQVYMYLKNFLGTKTKAVQLDGSTAPQKSGKVIIIFRYSIDGRKYKLLGDLTRKAIKDFIALADEQGSPALALKEYEEKGSTTLILANSNRPNGWHCTRFVAKSSDRLKQAA
jgi:hypothetical protein